MRQQCRQVNTEEVINTNDDLYLKRPNYRHDAGVVPKLRHFNVNPKVEGLIAYVVETVSPVAVEPGIPGKSAYSVTNWYLYNAHNNVLISKGSIRNTIIGSTGTGLKSAKRSLPSKLTK